MEGEGARGREEGGEGRTAEGREEEREGKHSHTVLNADFLKTGKYYMMDIGHILFI